MRGEVLERLADGLERLDRRLGRQWGPLSRSQWALMTRLRRGPVAVGALADRLAISTAGTTRMLDKLMARGYVERVRHPDDLRQVSAVLTDAGRLALLEARAAYCARLSELTAQLTEEDLARWSQLVDSAAPPRQIAP